MEREKRFVKNIDKGEYKYARRVIKVKDYTLNWCEVLLLMAYNAKYHNSIYPQDIIIGALKNIDNLQELYIKIMMSYYFGNCIIYLFPYFDSEYFSRYLRNNENDIYNFMRNAVDTNSEKIINFFINITEPYPETYKKVLEECMYYAVHEPQTLWIIDKLIEKKASINPEFYTDKPLYNAIYKENLQGVKYLLEKKANIDVESAQAAFSRYNLDLNMIKILRSHGMQIDTIVLRKYLDTLNSYSDLDNMELYLENYPRKVLNYTDENRVLKHLEILLFLIEEGATFSDFEPKVNAQVQRILNICNTLNISRVFIKKGMYNHELYDTNALKLLKTYL